MKPATSHMFRLISLSVIVALVIALFRNQVIDAIAVIETFSETPYAIPIACVIFFVGSVFCVPQWMLIAAAIAAFGFKDGAAVAWAATLLSAALHVIFAQLFRPRFDVSDNRGSVKMLRQLLSRNSFQCGLIIRIIPTGPAIAVNVIAALLGARQTAFLLGTALGIIPKILLTGLITSEVISVSQGQKIGLAIILFGILIIGAWAFLARHMLADYKNYGLKAAKQGK